MRLFALLVAAVLAAPMVSFSGQAARAGHTEAKHAWRKPHPRIQRDCTPLNGRYGYYGNPWCDTGSSRPPDIEFRERRRLRDR